MSDTTADSSPAGEPASTTGDQLQHPAASDLAAAYTELQHLLLETSDIAEFMTGVAVWAASVTHATAVGITMRQDQRVGTVAVSDEFASRVDEIQYGRGQGPCLQSLHTGQPVKVADLTDDDRWPDYRIHALTWGVRSSLSLPLTVNDTTIGALNLYSTEPHHFGQQETVAAEQFADHAAGTLTVVLRRIDQIALEKQLREGLAARAVIDQALGIIMGQRRITDHEAFAVLRETSQNSNRKMRDIAIDLITTITGQPPRPPKPFTQSR